MDEHGTTQEQMEHCWMRCSDPRCGKLRLVQKSTLDSLMAEGFLKGAALDDGWKTWLADAERRHGAVVAAQRKAEEGAGADTVEAGGVPEVCGDDDGGSTVAEDDGDASSACSSQGGGGGP